jgi:4-amino-4-deoxy-L-arabinose transferase-like glycosyltransferase
LDSRKAHLTIVALAVILPRIACFVLLDGYLQEPARDQELYLRLAGSIMEGEGLSFSDDIGLLKQEFGEDEGLAGQYWVRDPSYVFGMGRVNTPSAMVEPMYPLVLASFMMLFGRISGAVFLPNLLAQLIGAWAAMELASRLGGRRSGLPAGLLFALYPYFVFYSAIAMTESIHVAMIPVILLATVDSMAGRSRSMLAGLMSGLLFLFRSTALFILPLQLLFLFRERGLRQAVLLLAGFLMCAGPWVLRNQIEMGSPVLLPTKGSLNLWMRNNPEVLAEEGIFVPEGIPLNSPELLEYPSASRFTTEIERSGELSRRSMLFMLRNPLLVGWLSVERLASFLSPVPSTPVNLGWIPGVVFYAPAAALAGVAFYRQRRNRASGLLLAVFLLYTAMHALGHGGLRYRLPVDTILLVMAASLAFRKGVAE